MLGHRVLTLQDYTTILKRRWWVIALPMVLLSMAGVIATFFVEPQYVSQTLVLIEQQKVPDDYVKPVISEDLNARLASMQEQILSRSRLQPIIERFNLYGSNHMGMDSRIDKVRKDITIRPIQSDIARTNGLPGFFISFRAGDPRTAQLVCGEITSLFVSQNLSDRENSAEGTTDFLKGQLADAKRNLDEQDAKLAEFQRTYIGKLPGDEGVEHEHVDDPEYAAGCRHAGAGPHGAGQELRRDHPCSADTREPDGAATWGVQPQAQQVELQQLQAQEADLTSRYTDDYPDVVTVRRKIKELQQQMAKAPATPPPAAATTTQAGSGAGECSAASGSVAWSRPGHCREET